MEENGKNNGSPKMDASLSKENNTGTKPKKVNRTKAQPDVSRSSRKKNVNTSTKLKKIPPTKAQQGASTSFPKKNVISGAVLEKFHPTMAEPGVAVSSSKSVVNIGDKIKLIHFVTELPKGDLQPVKIRVIRDLSDLNISSSKKSEAQACAPKPSLVPVKQVKDYQFSLPSTSSGIKIEDLVLNRTWVDGDKKCMEFCGEGASNLVVPIDPPPKPEELSFCGEGASNLVVPIDPPPKPEEMSASGVPLRSMDSLGGKNLQCKGKIIKNSGAETSDRGYARVGDGIYNSYLTPKQKEKEDRLTKAYIEQDKDNWEFCGKGSSDIEFLLWPPQGCPPLEVLDIPLNSLEAAAAKHFRGNQK